MTPGRRANANDPGFFMPARRAFQTAYQNLPIPWLATCPTCIFIYRYRFAAWVEEQETPVWHEDVVPWPASCSAPAPRAPHARCPAGSRSLRSLHAAARHQPRHPFLAPFCIHSSKRCAASWASASRASAATARCSSADSSRWHCSLASRSASIRVARSRSA